MDEKKIVSADNAEEEIDIFYKRPSVTLTVDNARFYRSGGGLISLELKGENGEIEAFERVVAMRSFPITDPDAFISIREPDSAEHEKGAEIGIIPDINTFDTESVALLREELDRRYFTPEITKINAVKEKFGYLYFDAVTTAGNVTFVLNNPFSNIRILEDGRILIADIDGNVFGISNPSKLDAASLKKIEIYL